MENYRKRGPKIADDAKILNYFLGESWEIVEGRWGREDRGREVFIFAFFLMVPERHRGQGG